MTYDGSKDNTSTDDDHLNPFADDTDQEVVSDADKELMEMTDAWLAEEDEKSPDNKEDEEDKKDETSPETDEVVTGQEPEQKTTPDTDTDKTDRQDDQDGDLINIREHTFAQDQRVPAKVQPTGRIEYSNRGDVYNEEGQLVALRGKERRLWEIGNRAQGELVNSNALLQQANTRIEEFEAANQYATQNNITPEEQQTAVQIAAVWKNNPIQAIQQMLVSANELGYDVSQLFEDGDVPLNVSIPSQVSQQVNAALAPIVSQQQTLQQAQQQEQQQQQEVNNWLNNHQDARPHLEVMADMITAANNQGQSLDLNEAYWRLKTYSAENNLDFNAPLQPQLQQRNATNSNNTVTTANSQAPRGGGSVSTRTTESTNEVLTGYRATNTDDIIHSAMRENGLT